MTDPAAAQATIPAPAPTTPAPAPVAPVATPPAPPQATGPSAEDYAKLQTELANWKEQARKHEDRWKTRDDQIAKQEAALKLIAEKAGVDLDGQPDPAKLAEQLTAAQQQGRQAAVELAVYRAAAAAGANADLLLDSRTFMSKTAGLDPNSADFAERVKEYAADAVKTNPTLAAPATTETATEGQQDGQQQQPQQPAAPTLPATSGSDFSGAPHAIVPWTDDDINRSTPEELMKAIDNGQLAHMGVGPGRRGRRR